jgi:hypothetical protein
MKREKLITHNYKDYMKSGFWPLSIEENGGQLPEDCSGKHCAEQKPMQSTRRGRHGALMSKTWLLNTA